MRRMNDLWAQRREKQLAAAEPLAARMRPRRLEEFAGQQHFLGEGKLLRRMLEADRMTSVIFYGPPGTGKTTLAELIARHTHRHF
jgi:putative ATPase